MKKSEKKAEEKKQKNSRSDRMTRSRTINKNKILTVTMVLLLLSLFVLSGCVSKEIKGTEEEWCNSTMKLSGNNNTYTSKGITTYKNETVCEVIIENNNGSTTQYFNKDGSYRIVVYKDKSGNITREINMGK